MTAAILILMPKSIMMLGIVVSALEICCVIAHHNHHLHVKTKFSLELQIFFNGCMIYKRIAVIALLTLSAMAVSCYSYLRGLINDGRTGDKFPKNKV